MKHEDDDKNRQDKEREDEPKEDTPPDRDKDGIIIAPGAPERIPPKPPQGE